MNNPKQRIIYVLSASHSGSTLTAMLLGAHPEISSVGELNAKHLDDENSYLCSCRQKIKVCQFWQAIQSRMKVFGEEFSITDAQTDLLSGANSYHTMLLKPLVRHPFWEGLRDLALSRSPEWDKNIARFHRRNSYLIRSILEETQTNMIVDSSKFGLRLKYLLRNPALDVKVIWLVRDGRGVTLAYSNPSEFADSEDKKMHGGGTGKTFETPRNCAVGAHEWRRCIEDAMNVLKTMQDDQWIKVHYEEICQHPESTLNRIFDFLAVDSDQKELDYRLMDHHMIGNGMRLDSHSIISIDDRWRTELTPAQITQFNKIAGSLNQSLGYNDISRS